MNLKYAAFIVLVIISGSLFLWGLSPFTDYETRGSDTPITREEALQKAEIKLPLPTTAKNVCFHLSGETQNWNLYLLFEAPLEDVEAIINKELAIYSKNERLITGTDLPQFKRFPVSPDNAPSAVLESAPKWWSPLSIRNGYFIGSSDPHSGPRFWVDTDTSQVFFHEHF